MFCWPGVLLLARSQMIPSIDQVVIGFCSIHEMTYVAIMNGCFFNSPFATMTVQSRGENNVEYHQIKFSMYCLKGSGQNVKFDCSQVTSPHWKSLENMQQRCYCYYYLLWILLLYMSISPRQYPLRLSFFSKRMVRKRRVLLNFSRVVVSKKSKNCQRYPSLNRSKHSHRTAAAIANSSLFIDTRVLWLDG